MAQERAGRNNVSKNESEHGTIKLPAGAMKGVRAAVIEAANEEKLRLIAKANEVLPKLLAATKGKRDVRWESEVEKIIFGDFKADPQGYYRRSDDADYSAHDILRVLMPVKRVPLPTTEPLWMGKGHLDIKPKKPRAPKKGEIKALLLGKKVDHVSFDGATISFGKDGRHVEWDVNENNHAVETAHDHPVGKAFFRALGKITWTRGSGGTICGNDEYNRDGEGEGAGGNYVTAEYGPAAQKRERASRFSSFGSFGGGYGRRY